MSRRPKPKTLRVLVLYISTHLNPSQNAFVLRLRGESGLWEPGSGSFVLATSDRITLSEWLEKNQKPTRITTTAAGEAGLDMMLLLLLRNPFSMISTWRLRLKPARLWKARPALACYSREHRRRPRAAFDSATCCWLWSTKWRKGFPSDWGQNTHQRRKQHLQGIDANAQLEVETGDHLCF